MRLLDPWRQELRALIPRGFLRQDQRRDALFASDFPRFPEAETVAAALRGAGWLVDIRRHVAHLDADADKYAVYLRSLPLLSPAPTDPTLRAWGLAHRLARRDVLLEEQPLPAIGQLMKRLDAGDPKAIDDFSAFAARCQREHAPLPAAAGKVIFLDLSRNEGGADPC